MLNLTNHFEVHSMFIVLFHLLCIYRWTSASIKMLHSSCVDDRQCGHNATCSTLDHICICKMGYTIIDNLYHCSPFYCETNWDCWVEYPSFTRCVNETCRCDRHTARWDYFQPKPNDLQVDLFCDYDRTCDSNNECIDRFGPNCECTLQTYMCNCIESYMFDEHNRTRCVPIVDRFFLWNISAKVRNTAVISFVLLFSIISLLLMLIYAKYEMRKTVRSIRNAPLHGNIFAIFAQQQQNQSNNSNDDDHYESYSNGRSIIQDQVCVGNHFPTEFKVDDEDLPPTYDEAIQWEVVDADNNFIDQYTRDASAGSGDGGNGYQPQPILCQELC